MITMMIFFCEIQCSDYVICDLWILKIFKNCPWLGFGLVVLAAALACPHLTSLLSLPSCPPRFIQKRRFTSAAGVLSHSYDLL